MRPTSLPLSTSAFICSTLLCLTSVVWADGPKDNIPDSVRPVPPEGIELSVADREELLAGLKQLDAEIDRLRKDKKGPAHALLPDVEIFSRAVHQAVEHGELFSAKDTASAKQLIQVGLDRAQALAKGNAPWTTEAGLVVRGFRSKIDQTVQPYGLVIPESYTFTGKSQYRLDIWLHGRGEKVTEVPFIAQRMSQAGIYTPKDTLVLHPFGRYCNAFKFAGEIDILEAMQHAKEQYRIDDDRVAIRGFSMGGAGCWQMAVHYSDLFFAANPGAGFSETPEFLKSFQQETLNPTPFEKTLWQMYDCPEYASNLQQLPTVAYSGELDIQKQAADVMAKSMELQHRTLTHIIGPETKHSIHPESQKIIEAKLDSLAEVGRNKVPMQILFSTPTLRYNRMHWLTVTQLDEHWKPAEVRATLLPGPQNEISIVTNARGIKIDIPAGRSPFRDNGSVVLDLHFHHHQLLESTLLEVKLGSDNSFSCEVHFADGEWKLGPPPAGLRKKHNLQGPIDDAFMGPFIVVKPTGKSKHALVDKWTQSELEHFVREWRSQFRGDAIVKRDDEITEADIASSNLILFGDVDSNKVLASIAAKLPIQWNADQLVVGETKYDPAHHAPVLIYPNPANPERYIVLNSGFTYREYAYLNNARQVPKLPDWAIVDLRQPPDSLWPGKIVDADFFDERWQLKAKAD